jgi:hypothetical protein
MRLPMEPQGGSGTNDKAGSILNLVRWISPRTIKETFAPARSYEYPFLAEKQAPDPDGEMRPRG